MNLKLDFRGNLFKTKEKPATLASLKKVLEGLFKNKLNLDCPYFIKYRDSDDELICLETEDDFEIMHEHYNESHLTNIKLFISQESQAQEIQGKQLTQEKQITQEKQDKQDKLLTQEKLEGSNQKKCEVALQNMSKSSPPQQEHASSDNTSDPLLRFGAIQLDESQEIQIKQVQGRCSQDFIINDSVLQSLNINKGGMEFSQEIMNLKEPIMKTMKSKEEDVTAAFNQAGSMSNEQLQNASNIGHIEIMPLENDKQQSQEKSQQTQIKERLIQQILAQMVSGEDLRLSNADNAQMAQMVNEGKLLDQMPNLDLADLQIHCLKCKNKDKNGKFPLCFACNGTGKYALSDKQFKQLQSIMEYKLKNKYNKLLQLNNLIKIYQNNLEIYQSETTKKKHHQQFVCVLCDNSINIFETRYECPQCESVVICQMCEQKVVHVHSLLKLGKGLHLNDVDMHLKVMPQMNSSDSIMTANSKLHQKISNLMSQSQINTGSQSMFSIAANTQNLCQNQKSWPESSSLMSASQSFNNSAPFIRNLKAKLETDIKSQNVGIGQQYKVNLTIKNSGDQSWPHDCVLQCVAGIHEQTHFQMSTVKPDQKISLEMQLKAPDQLGKHSSFWRPSYHFKEAIKYFGPRITIDIQVVKLQDNNTPNTNTLNHHTAITMTPMPQTSSLHQLGMNMTMTPNPQSTQHRSQQNTHVHSLFQLKHHHDIKLAVQQEIAYDDQQQPKKILTPQKVIGKQSVHTPYKEKESDLAEYFQGFQVKEDVKQSQNQHEPTADDKKDKSEAEQNIQVNHLQLEQNQEKKVDSNSNSDLILNLHVPERVQNTAKELQKQLKGNLGKYIKMLMDNPGDQEIEISQLIIKYK